MHKCNGAPQFQSEAINIIGEGINNFEERKEEEEKERRKKRKPLKRYKKSRKSNINRLKGNKTGPKSPDMASNSPLTSTSALIWNPLFLPKAGLELAKLDSETFNLDASWK